MSTVVAEPPKATTPPADSQAPDIKPFSYENKDVPSFDQFFAPAEPEPKKQEQSDDKTTSPDPKPADKPADKTPAGDKTPSKPSLDDGLPADKAKQPPAQPDKPADIEPKSAPELRKAYAETKSRVSALESELAQLRASKPADQTPQESEAYKAEVAKLKDQIKRYEEDLRFSDYTRSEEYRNQYEKPWADEINRAKAELPSFTVTGADGNERQATLDDLTPLLNLPAGKAWAAARATFGDATPAIMRYRDRLVDIYQRSEQAKQEYREKGAQLSKEREAQILAKNLERVESTRKAFDGYINERATKNAALYGADESDPEGNKLLDSGRKLVDIAFKGAEDIAEEDLVKIQAEVAARATGFGRMVHRNRQLSEKITALEAKLAEYEKSQPGKGDKDVEKGGNDSRPDWEREFDKIPAYRG